MKNVFATETENKAVLEALTDREYVLSHVRLAVQKKSREVTQTITQQLLNLELFMRIRLDCLCGDNTTGSTRVTKSILSLADISEKEIWDAARSNTAKELIVGSMSELFLGEDIGGDELFYIATTRDNFDGAAAIAFPELLRTFCDAHEVEKCAILPSSTQEMLLIPEKDEMSYGDLAELVNAVNQTPGIVSDNIALDPVAYRYDLVTNSISIAACAM